MPKPPRKPELDPMAHVVDRLLAQLPGLQGGVERVPSVTRSSSGELRVVSGGSRIEEPTILGLWVRVTLGLTLGAMMTVWPYFRECGLPLIGYLCAVLVVVGVGGWIAVTAWKLQSAVAHVLALILLLWGLALTADLLLRRSGYAAAAATWQCEVPGSAPSWMKWFASSSGPDL
jgi:hypothetical protein